MTGRKCCNVSAGEDSFGGYRGYQMRIHLTRERPESWAERKARVRARWAEPFWRMHYQMEWCVYLLSNWTFPEVLEYLSSFDVLVAVFFYFAEPGDRLKHGSMLCKS